MEKEGELCRAGLEGWGSGVMADGYKVSLGVLMPIVETARKVTDWYT